MLAALAMAATIATRHQVLIGDFDRDGRPDRAEIVPLGRDRMQIVIRRAADPHHPVVLYSGRAWLDPVLSRASKGVWETACAKAYAGISDPGCTQRQVQTRGGELTFGEKESTSFIAIWTGKRFITLQLTD